MSSAPIAFERLLDLAPHRLVSHRKERYDGTQISASVDDFSDPAREAITRAYVEICDLKVLLEPALDDLQEAQERLEDYMRRRDWREYLLRIPALEPRQAGLEPNHPVRKVAHDIKGGGLAALVGTIQFVEHGVMQPTDIAQCFFLARDHTKMMRNALPDLDRARYDIDYGINYHHLDLIAEKWTGSHQRDGAGRGVDVHADVRSDAAIATRCIEFSALDRVLYNLINNAVRHTADEQVYLSAFLTEAEPQNDVRFVVANPIDASHRERLATLVDQPQDLFREGVTTSSTGLGLRICSEFVANAYGLGNPETCVTEGYVGAELLDDHFVAWVHWPLVAD